MALMTVNLIEGGEFNDVECDLTQSANMVAIRAAERTGNDWGANIDVHTLLIQIAGEAVLTAYGEEVWDSISSVVVVETVD